MDQRIYEYPVQGKLEHKTTGFVKVASFRIDLGVHAHTETQTTKMFKKGDVILGFRAKVIEALTSTGSATLILGFSGTTMLSADTAKTALDAIGDILGPDNSADAAALCLESDDTFDTTVGTAALTAGKVDIDVIYLPAARQDLGTDFKEYVSTA